MLWSTQKYLPAIQPGFHFYFCLLAARLYGCDICNLSALLQSARTKNFEVYTSDQFNMG